LIFYFLFFIDDEISRRAGRVSRGRDRYKYRGSEGSESSQNLTAELLYFTSLHKGSEERGDSEVKQRQVKSVECRAVYELS